MDEVTSFVLAPDRSVWSLFDRKERSDHGTFRRSSVSADNRGAWRPVVLGSTSRWCSEKHVPGLLSTQSWHLCSR